MLLTVHEYNGSGPGLLGFAVKVTDVPAQTGFVGVLMDTPTATLLLTVTVTEFEVAGLLLAHPRLDVKVQNTTTFAATPGV